MKNMIVSLKELFASGTLRFRQKNISLLASSLEGTLLSPQGREAGPLASESDANG